MKKILVAFDGSQGSILALKTAKEIGEKFNSHILILTVTSLEGNMNLYRDMFYAEEVKKTIDAEAHQRLLKAENIMKGYPAKFQCMTLDGDSATEIVEFAKEERVNLIVIGSRGHGTFSRMLLGSVSGKVANLSEVSTLIVKSPEDYVVEEEDTMEPRKDHRREITRNDFPGPMM